MTSTKRALWLPDALRDSGLAVVTYPGWEKRGRDFRDLRAAVWHHDASPRGDSPGVPGYMLRNWARAAAQAWVSRYGIWHILAAGVAHHAGRVLPGKPGNYEALGIETDHTTGEVWTQDQLDSLRWGTAVFLRELREAPDPGLDFHRTIARPLGRKTDPAGLDLHAERRTVGALMARKGLLSLTHTPSTEDVMTKDQEARILAASAAQTAEIQALRNEVGRPSAEAPSTVHDRLRDIQADLGTGGETR